MKKDVISFISASEEKYSIKFNKGKYYNIFTELSITTDEVKHSSFLKGLIDPNGLHGCGDFFYLLFIKKIGIDINKKEFIWLKDNKNINIYTEYFIGSRDHKNDTHTEDYYGRIDLLIEHSKENKALVIENKIHAKDQPQQLKRYFDFSSKKYGKINESFWIYYLTLDNKKPNQNSYKGIEKDDIIFISYKDEILNWLKNCLDCHLLNKNVKFSIKQYIKVILQLTNQDLNITSELLKTDEYSHLNVNDIIRKRDNLRKDFFKLLFTELKKKLPEFEIKYVHKIHNEVTNIEDILKPFKHKKNFGICLKKDELIINVEVQNYSKFIFGIFNPNKDSEICKKMEYLGFEYKSWWQLKEIIFKNNGIPYSFYEDNLNYTFLKNSDKFVNNVTDEIINLINKVTK